MTDGPRSYRSPGAFRTALTERLKTKAQTDRWTLPQLQRQIAYDRLLERLYLVDDGWVVKGATALLARDIGVRATVDIDMYRATARDVAEADLRQAAARDIGDWFRFEIGAPHARTFLTARGLTRPHNELCPVVRVPRRRSRSWSRRCQQTRLQPDRRARPRGRRPPPKPATISPKFVRSEKRNLSSHQASETCCKSMCSVTEGTVAGDRSDPGPARMKKHLLNRGFVCYRALPSRSTCDRLGQVRHRSCLPATVEGHRER